MIRIPAGPYDVHRLSDIAEPKHSSVDAEPVAVGCGVRWLLRNITKAGSRRLSLVTLVLALACTP